MIDTVKEDRKLAEKVCKELRSGNKEAILEIYHRFHPFFQSVAMKRAGNTGQTGDLLTDFWIELMNGSAICAYKGLNNAALRSYLTKILLLRIIDLQRKLKTDRKHLYSPIVREDFTEDEYFSQATLISQRSGQNGITGGTGEPEQSPEDMVIRDERRRLFQKALLLLHDFSPRDAKYIRLRMNGMTYEEIAEQEADIDKTNRQTIVKKTEAIRKQYTRENSGSLAKFRIIIENLMAESGMKKEDIL